MCIATLDTISDAGWRPWAACAHLGPTLFYGHAPTTLCAACPASEPCLWAAMALEQVLGYHHGVWGGTTAQRRRRIAAQLGADVDYRAWYLGVVDQWSSPPSSTAA